MKTLTILNSAKLALGINIENFENEEGIKLPDSFINFLLLQNPITIQEDYFLLNNKEYNINGFFPFDKDSDDSLQSTLEDFKDFLENKYVVFADDYGGWLYVISVQEADYGKVYFCRIDEELEDALTLLTNNFEEFLELLIVNPNN